MSTLAEIRAQVTNSQRAQELRRFFAPFDALSSAPTEERVKEINASLLDDGALDSYAEAVLWRLGARRAMVSLVDGQTQFFLAGAVRHDVQAETDRLWYGCSTVHTRGGLCENTLALDRKQDSHVCFVIPDLSKDDRFCHLPVVDGSIAQLRFYAGTPITTNRGVNIGSFFIFDTEPRQDGLALPHRKFLVKSAAFVMRHLEIKREAAERRRLALMSAGLASFLELNTQDINEFTEIFSANRANANSEENGSKRQEKEERKRDVPNLVRRVLERSAEILCESLELDVGGVILFDNAAGITEANLEETLTELDLDRVVESPTGLAPSCRPGGEGSLEPGPEIDMQLSPKHDRQFLDFHDQKKDAKVLAMATGKHSSGEETTRSLNQKTLQSLVKSYPKGNVWYIDDEGFFPSLEQMDSPDPEASVRERRPSQPTTTFKRQQAEAKLLAQTFANARQILFIPLWDAAARRWHSGCCAWSQSPVPVFTVDSEIAFLSAFTNSVMAEVSRLDAIAAHHIKSDFISSISHEFRSPMHAILASAEFLRETDYSDEQAGLIFTIQNSGYTLLDTINQVLDYSKINSFERGSRKTGSHQGCLQNELFAVTNLAFLVEEIVTGMVKAKYFQSPSGLTGSGPIAPTISNHGFHKASSAKAESEPVKIILDLSPREWKYFTQPGALRRIISNLFGNAQRYTDSGSIWVSLTAEDITNSIPKGEKVKGHASSVVILTIQDTGRGMSADFLNKSLYTPFTQEDTFASGIGLGLSIVRSIVDQLGGTIKIWSEAGRGTKVQLRLPLETTHPEEKPLQHDLDVHDLASNFEEAEQSLVAIRKFAEGKVIGLRRPASRKKAGAAGEPPTLDVVEQYLTRWLGLTVKPSSDLEDTLSKADLIITDEEDSWPGPSPGPGMPPIFLICHSRTSLKARICQAHPSITGFITGPIGPYKLAHSLLAHFRGPEEGTSGTLLGAEETSNKHNFVQESWEVTNLPLRLKGQEFASSTNLNGSTEELNKSSPLTKPSTKKSQRPTSSSGPVSLPNNEGPKRRPLTTTSPSSQRRPRPKRGPSQPTNSRPLHILVVDDNEINLQLLQRYLAKRKADTIGTAGNGIEAVAAFKEAAASESPHDLIFMDLSMPLMDGFEATRVIRGCEAKSGGHVFIVALTGLASQRDREEAANSGVDDYMTKPVSFVRVGEFLGERSTVGVDGDEKGTGDWDQNGDLIGGKAYRVD